jgi:hypothetical protein
LNPFFIKLHNINSHHAEWAIAIHKAYEWFEGASLDLEVLNVPEPYSEGIPNTSTYRSSIFIATSTVSPTSIDGKDLIRRITHARNDNIDRWFHANPDIFQDLATRFNTNNNPTLPHEPHGGVPVPTQPTATIVHETRSVDATNMRRACIITQLLLS